jgi:hypothetical protein
MAKRKTQRKVAKEESCEYCGCSCKWGMLKLASMAFILFLVTVWRRPVGNWLIGVPWWVYLIILVVFGVAGMSRGCWCHRE